MANPILGNGWKFPLEFDSKGSIACSGYEDSIRESIILILSTSKGERVMRPDFGSGIHEYVFQVINTSSLALIKSSIQEALRTYEPRIEVTDISINTESVSNGVLKISVDYTVIQTNNQFNLVYPFYLFESS